MATFLEGKSVTPSSNMWVSTMECKEMEIRLSAAYVNKVLLESCFRILILILQIYSFPVFPFISMCL